jgi:hypothetical protein
LYLAEDIQAKLRNARKLLLHYTSIPLSGVWKKHVKILRSVWVFLSAVRTKSCVCGRKQNCGDVDVSGS